MPEDHPDFEPTRELNSENVERSSVERAVELLNSAWGLAGLDDEPELDDDARSERVQHYLLAGCYDLVALAASDPGELAELMEATSRLRPRGGADGVHAARRRVCAPGGYVWPDGR